jgi:hypothetical protein
MKGVQQEGFRTGVGEARNRDVQQVAENDKVDLVEGSTPSGAENQGLGVVEGRAPPKRKKDLLTMLA